MTQDTPNSAQLPPLPEPSMSIPDGWDRPCIDSFTAAQMQAYALEALRTQAASVEPVAHLAWRGAFRVSQHGQDAESHEWLELVDGPAEKGAFPVYLTPPTSPNHIPADVEAQDVGDDALTGIARRLTLATDEGDDVANGTHYIDKAGAIRCKGSFLALIEDARAALATKEAK